MAYRKYWKQIHWEGFTPFGEFMKNIDKMLPWKPYKPFWKRKGFTRSADSPPLVRIPVEVWRDLMAMAELANGEYSTFLEIDHDPEENEYRVLSWYLPYQDASWGHAKLTAKGAVQLAIEALDRLPRMYGVFHIHPSRHTPGSNIVAGLSGTDYGAMWTWVSNAKRGVFIVSHIGGGASAELCTEVDGKRLLAHMDIKIDSGVSVARRGELATMMTERVNGPAPLVYKGSPVGSGWPYNNPHVWDWRAWAKGYDPEEDTDLTVVDLSEPPKGYWEIGDLAMIRMGAPGTTSGMGPGIPYMVTEVDSAGVHLWDMESPTDDREWFYLYDEVIKITVSNTDTEFEEAERRMLIHDIAPEEVKRLEDLRDVMR